MLLDTIYQLVKHKHGHLDETMPMRLLSPLYVGTAKSGRFPLD
jgi:hypothetical protein